jgi:colanic acid biosynthesis glycosyl transferase WcaI
MYMANILFVTPYYPPEIGAAQTRISETAVRLVKRGHRVTVLTTLPNYPLGKVFPDYRDRSRRREVRDGVEIVRVWSFISPKKGFLHRILSYLSFGCLSPFLAGRAVGKPDVILVESPPLFDAIGGRLLAWMKRCPYVFIVADIWPESAIQLGVLHNRLLIRLSEWLEWSTYRRAGAVWAVTAGIRQTLMQRGLPEKNVFLLPNGVDTEKFQPRSQAEARAELGWEAGFTVLYAGTIGLAQGLKTMLDAAEQLREYPDIRLVLVGEGVAKPELMAEAQRRHLTNVTFFSSQPHDRMPLILSAADACLVPLRKLPLFEGALPSKLYETMACARPMLLAVDGEARHLIVEQAGAALYVEPENASALAQAVLQLRDQPALARQLGQRGREFVKAHFDRDKLVAALDERLQTLMGKPEGIAEAQVQFPALQGTSENHSG